MEETKTRTQFFITGDTLLHKKRALSKK